MRCLELALLLLISCSACRSAPAVDELLGQQHDTQGSLSEALSKADAQAQLALAGAQRSPLDFEQQLAASVALARVVDLRLMAYQLDRIEAESLTVDELVLLDDAADAEVKTAVLGLCRAGLVCARAARELAPDSADAVCYLGLHLSLVAWAENRATALFKGRGPELQKLTKLLARDYPAALDAAPLRLRGRFLDRAPWPYGDRKQGQVLLTRAAQLAPIALNWQFLGDVRWSLGDKPGAAQAWRSGALAGSANEPYTSWRQALNQARLDALSQPQP